MDFIPDLPLDVARLLLEEAAWSDRFTTARTLTLVSKDVRQWIDPILHHTVTLDTHTKLDAFAATVIARNDPAFFRRTVKVLTILTIDNLELEHVSEEIIDLTDSMTVILTACAGIERFAFWIAATVQIPPKNFHLLWKDLRPTHVSLAVGNGANSFPLVFAMMSPSLTHLHLDFTSPGYLTIYNSRAIGVWPAFFKDSPGLTHLQLSGNALETLKPQDFHEAIDPIVSVLPHTVTKLTVNVISLRARTDRALRVSVQLKTLQADPRVVFILPPEHPLHAVEELRAHEKNRDGCFNWGSWGDIDCEEFFQ